MPARLSTDGTKLIHRLSSILLVAVALAATTQAPARSATIGPALDTAPEVLAAALTCTPDIDHPSATPVLLVHGTSSTPSESWSFGYARVLPTLGHPVCTVELPARSWDDIQTSSEYVVYAIRTMAERSGTRISVIGHSQGTLQPLWALRFWPDLADLVDDYVGLAPPLQGTTAAIPVCALPGKCPAAVWQFRANAQFIAALNRRALPAGPSYTAIATWNDELVWPQPTASRRSGVTTVMVQSICVGRFVEHVGLLGDAVAYAITLDALTHAGPADPDRIPRSVCRRALLPGIDVTAYLNALPVFVANFAATALTATWVAAEPPLRPYAREG
jgi:triacylglycerol lipase